MELKNNNNEKKDEEYLVTLINLQLATLAIDLDDRNYLGSVCCSLYGLQVSFVAWI